MVTVDDRNVITLNTKFNIIENLFFSKAVILFFSRIILRKLDSLSKNIFRKVERNIKLNIKLNADSNFLKFALHNRLLPKFTNFKLYDVSAEYEESTIKFKEDLLKREIDKKSREQSDISKICIKSILEFRRNTSDLYFYSAVQYLHRIASQYESDIVHRHVKKLSNLYGGNVFVPQITENIINLSQHILSASESSVLNKGLNFSMKYKQKPIDKQIEIEKLYMSILDKRDKNEVDINQNEHLKAKLKCFGIRHSTDISPDPLTRQEKEAAKNLKINDNIVIQRPDKGGGVVIMNKTDYTSKLKTLINDPTKFIKCNKKQSANVKTELNRISETFKKSNWNLYHKLRRIGEFNLGHLYGLPKVHKSQTDPPLRPIISMSGTVTHDISQFLNSIIRPFLNKTKMVLSSTEVLVELQSIHLSPSDHLVSLDVESLFTNVPVATTIDFIIDSVYSHSDLPPPEIPVETLRSLLKICTTENPFEFDGETYIQVDGVSMGSPLGPTFADFYMSQIENELLSQNEISNPSFYRRYVDDIIAVFNDRSHVEWFKTRFSNNSVLKFTHEEIENNLFHFLDIQLNLNADSKFHTSVYIKPTDKGIYANYHSHIPETYKRSVVKTLVYRAYKYSSTWKLFNSEIDRIKQVLANNSYPQFFVERIIENVINKLRERPDNMDRVTNGNINLYVKLENLSTIKKDEHLLKRIISEHLTPTATDTKIKLIPYYKPRKLSSMFSTRPNHSDLHRANVVYQFQCQEDSCNASYIGHTTNTLQKRASQHRYSPSSIFKHYNIEHDRPVPINDVLRNQFKVLHQYSNPTDLKIAEAICIREARPYINVKYNEMFCHLNLYR